MKSEAAAHQDVGRDERENTTVELNLRELDLGTMQRLDGTALGSVVKSFEKSLPYGSTHSRHSSHTSYSRGACG